MEVWRLHRSFFDSSIYGIALPGIYKCSSINATVFPGNSILYVFDRIARCVLRSPIILSVQNSLNNRPTPCGNSSLNESVARLCKEAAHEIVSVTFTVYIFTQARSPVSLLAPNVNDRLIEHIWRRWEETCSTIDIVRRRDPTARTDHPGALPNTHTEACIHSTINEMCCFVG